MTVQTIGWVVQVQLNDEWTTWTQWRARSRAEQQRDDLLATGRYSAARILRVDWTVVEDAAA